MHLTFIIIIIIIIIIIDAFISGDRSTILIVCYHFQNATYKQEVQLFHRLEAQINHILAKHSPVVIVQRYLRGYFSRKR